MGLKLQLYSANISISSITHFLNILEMTALFFSNSSINKDSRKPLTCRFLSSFETSSSVS